jgi:hypothetical protein
MMQEYLDAHMKKRLKFNEERNLVKKIIWRHLFLSTNEIRMKELR